MLAVVAALQPLWGEGTASSSARGADVVVCLDVSRSMLARDVPPSRLAAAKREIRALARTRAGDRLALVLFAGEARLAAPLTSDVESFCEIVDLADPLSVGRGGTDLGAALEAALAALEGAAGDHAAVILVTDGEDLGGRGLRAAEACKARNVAVHCVGFGSAGGAKIPVAGDGGTTFLRDRGGAEVVSALDPDGLRRIAEATGGEAVVDAGARPGRSPTSTTAASARWRAGRSRPSGGAIARTGSRARSSSPSRRGSQASASPIGDDREDLRVPVATWCDAGPQGSGPAGLSSPPAPHALRLRRRVRGALHNRAVAALRAGDLVAAEIAAEKAAAKGGPEFEARRDFVLGNAAFARCEKDEFAAMGPRGASAIDAAIGHAERARDFWRRAAAGRSDWPEARSNVERARIKLDALKLKRDELTSASPPPKPKPPPPPTEPSRAGPTTSPRRRGSSRSSKRCRLPTS